MTLTHLIQIVKGYFSVTKFDINIAGGAKVKKACCAKLAVFRKTSTIVFIKTFWFFLVKDLTNRVLFSYNHSYWNHVFLAMMRRPKNGWPLSATFIAYFYYPQQIGNNFRKWRLMIAFVKIKIEKFWWKLKEYKPYLCCKIGTWSITIIAFRIFCPKSI